MHTTGSTNRQERLDCWPMKGDVDNCPTEEYALPSMVLVYMLACLLSVHYQRRPTTGSLKCGSPALAKLPHSTGAVPALTAARWHRHPCLQHRLACRADMWVLCSMGVLAWVMPKKKIAHHCHACLHPCIHSNQNCCAPSRTKGKETNSPVTDRCHIRWSCFSAEPDLNPAALVIVIAQSPSCASA